MNATNSEPEHSQNGDLPVETVYEDATSESAVRLKSILDTTVDAIIVIDESGIVEAFNPAAEHLLGYRLADVVNQNVKMLMPSHYSENHDGFLMHYRTTGERKIIGIGREVECLRKDGSVFPAELAVSEMLLDGKKHFTGVLRDITERKQAESEIRETAAHLKSILDTTVDAMIVIDEKGIIENFNRAAENLLGYSARQVIGQNVKMLMPEHYSTHHDGYLSRYVEEGDPHIIGIGREVECRRKDGTIFPAELSVSQFDSKGFRRFTGILRDITERKRSEQLLREAKELLEERVRERTERLESINAELETFAHGISHDLRAPLRAVAGYAGVLREDYGDKLDEDGHDYLDRIVGGIKRIDRLLNDLLSLARLGRGDAAIVDLNLRDLIQEVCSQLESEIETRRAEIRFPEQMPTIKGYRSVALLMIQNLIANGIRYAPEDRTPQIDISTETRNEKVQLQIKDNGRGIPSEYLALIFKPFERLDSRSRVTGSGLGLALVEKGATLHGGEAWAQSETGVGSTFFVTFGKPQLPN